MTGKCETHGWTYTPGCGDCQFHKAEYAKAYRLRSRARIAAGEMTVDHGTVNAYNNLGCQCQPCRDAWTAEVARLRERRMVLLASGEIEAPHGIYTTYGNYGCRCEECREAMRRYTRDRRARKSA